MTLMNDFRAMGPNRISNNYFFFVNTSTGVYSNAKFMSILFSLGMSRRSSLREFFNYEIK